MRFQLAKERGQAEGHLAESPKKELTRGVKAQGRSKFESY